MASLGEIFEASTKGFKKVFNRGSKEVLETTEKETANAIDSKFVKSQNKKILKELRDPTEIDEEALERINKTIEDTRYHDNHLSDKKKYDEMFNSNSIADHMTYERNKVIQNTANGPELDHDSFRQSRKEMMDRYNNAYKNASTDISRKDFYDAQNAAETSTNVTNKKAELDKTKAANKKWNEAYNQQAIEKYGGNDKDFSKFKVAKKEQQSKFQGKMDKALSKAIPMAVGGGLIFSMFNRGGQMSNSELYGQSTPYSGGGY
jgi:hypothetical protein